MSFLRRLFGGREAGAPTGSQETDAVLWLTAECETCGERLRVRINKHNDLSLAADTVEEEGQEGDGEEAPASGYVLRKELLGNNCPRLMEVRASFDARRRLISLSGRGCRLLPPDDGTPAP